MTSTTPTRPAPIRPVHQIRLGTLKAAIWAFPTERNTLRYSVTLQRIYKDKGLWRRSDVYRRDDLLTLAKVLDLAHSWIHAQDRSAAQRPQTPQEQPRSQPPSNPIRPAEPATTARGTTPSSAERAATSAAPTPSRAKATRMVASAPKSGITPAAEPSAQAPAA